MVNIFKWRPALYISQARHTDMFSMLCMFFSDNLVELHSRNKAVLETTTKWTQTKYMEPPWWNPRWDDRNEYMERMIWCSNKEIIIFWRCSRLQNRRFWFRKPKGSVFTDQTQIRVKIFIVFGMILWFIERAMSARLYICRSRLIVKYTR
jgi:hypothetical protein